MNTKDLKVCCICGKTFAGFGNNPWGAIGKDGKAIEWGKYSVCCDECNKTHVLSGRLYLYAQANKDKK